MIAYASVLAILVVVCLLAVMAAVWLAWVLYRVPNESNEEKTARVIAMDRAAFWAMVVNAGGALMLLGASGLVAFTGGRLRR
jgi:hypothetical protein